MYSLKQVVRRCLDRGWLPYPLVPMESVARFDLFAPLLYQTARGADAELLVLG